MIVTTFVSLCINVWEKWVGPKRTNDDMEQAIIQTNNTGFEHLKFKVDQAEINHAWAADVVRFEEQDANLPDATEVPLISSPNLD